MSPVKDWSALCHHIGYGFHNPDLLKRALTHRSGGSVHNERLEFLGDAVLDLAMADVLCQQFPNTTEGKLSRMRASLVRGHSLAKLARKFQLGDFLILGVSEAKSGGQNRDSILEDAMEALIGAIYVDSDFATAKCLISDWFADKVQALSPDADVIDAKSRLQEYLQQYNQPLPEYTIVKTEGAEHEQIFTIRCSVASLSLSAEAKGTSRKKAEQAAAALLLENIPGDAFTGK